MYLLGFLRQNGIKKRTITLKICRDNALTQLGVHVNDRVPCKFISRRDERTERDSFYFLCITNPETIARSLGLPKGCTKCSALLGKALRAGQCTYCKKHVCSKCLSQQTIAVRYDTITYLNFKIPEFMWDRPSEVCLDCFNDISRQIELLNTIYAFSLGILNT